MNSLTTRSRGSCDNAPVSRMLGHLDAAVSKVEAATAIAVKELRKLARIPAGVALVAACLIALSFAQAQAAPGVTYDIVEFSCSESKSVGEDVELTVHVRKEGRSPTGTTLTLSGIQGGVGIFSESRTILEGRRAKEAEEAFRFEAVSGGEIRWTATVDGDESRCTTRVEGGGDPPTTSDNVIGLHDSSSQHYNKQCLDCHAGIPTEESLEPGIHGTHMTMSDFVPGENTETKCVWCHRTVDLTADLLGPQPAEKTSANLRKHVDVRLCTVCHGNPPRSTARQFYQVGLFPTGPDGPVLYDLMCAACHKDLAQSEVRNESASEIAGEIAANEGGMGPLGVLTAAEIQAIADALAQ